MKPNLKRGTILSLSQLHKFKKLNNNKLLHLKPRNLNQNKIRNMILMKMNNLKRVMPNKYQRLIRSKSLR